MKTIDIFGEPIKVLLNKQQTIKTSIGGFLTILTLLMILVFTWFIGKDIIKKEKPSSYTQKDIFNKFQNISINNTNFPFSFQIMNRENEPLLDYSYLTPKLYEYNYRFNLKNQTFLYYNEQEHKTKFCNFSDFPLLSKEQFEEALLSQTLCPVKQNFNIYGFWHEAELRYLEIVIEGCKNKTSGSGIVCKSPKEIEEYITKTGANLNIFYLDSSVLINNNDAPLERFSVFNYKYVVPDFLKSTMYKIQSQNIITDNGFVFSESASVQFFKIIEESSEMRVLDREEFRYLVFEIYSSNTSESYFRRYIKVPQIIASVSGLLKVFTFAFLMLDRIFSTVEKNISIVNEVFVLNRKEDKLLLSSIEKEEFKSKRKNFNLFENINENTRIIILKTIAMIQIRKGKKIYLSVQLICTMLYQIEKTKALNSLLTAAA